MIKDNMTEREIEELARRSLDESVESLDAATLSQLNQARQQALEAGARSPWRRMWLPMATAGFAMLALAVALPLLNPADPAPAPEIPGMMDDSYMSASQDPELLEDLDLMLWLVDTEDHAS
jgi:hypothetical protein